MYYTESSIIIAKPIEEVFPIILNVEKWPEIFPPCQEVKILEKNKNNETIEITALTRGKIFIWQSLRKINLKEYTVYFEQLKPAKPLTFLSGQWICKKMGNRTKIVLSHTFDIKFKLIKRIIAFIVKRFFIDTNSEQELEGIKQYLKHVK